LVKTFNEVGEKLFEYSFYLTKEFFQINRLKNLPSHNTSIFEIHKNFFNKKIKGGA